jgi:WD40 repeat protein
VWVVATVRAEFLGPLLEQPGTGQFVDETLLVSPLDRSRLFAVIEGPAARAGLQFAPGLVGRLVEDTQGGDALPLLAFTLRELAEQAGPEGQITTNAYESIGGVVGALRTQADRTATKLAASGHLELLVPTLTKLATVSEAGEPTRRRIPRNGLSTAEDQIVQTFIDARLLVSGVDEQGEVVVGVAHEALLRQWPPLRQAIEGHRDELRVRADLERWVQDWERADRQSSYLVGGERLEVAQRWATAHPHELMQLPGSSEFLARSARQQELNAQRGSEAVANRALEELDRDPELAILLAIAAVEEYGISPRARIALSSALAMSYPDKLIRGHQAEVAGVAFSPDGTRLATASLDRTARVWVLSDGTELQSLQHQDWVQGVAFSPDGTRLATASRDKTAQVWALADAELHTLFHQAEVMGVAFSPDGTRLATACRDRTARIWDLSSGTQLQTLHHEGWVEGVAFSSDGTRLATASRDHTARIWDSATGTEMQTLHHQAEVERVAFSPDSTYLATASSYGKAWLWKVNSTVELHDLGHEVEVTGVAFSPDGTRLATASNYGTARIWDMVNGVELQPLDHQAEVMGVAFSPDGTRLATACRDRTARIWDLSSGTQLQTLHHEGWVEGVAFSSDGTRLATASRDHTARIWDQSSGIELQTVHHGEWVQGVAFSPDGTRLATASLDRTARIWAVRSDAMLLTTARMRVDRQLTLEERRMVGFLP